MKEWTFGDLLGQAMEAGATKIHLSIDSPPMMRVPLEGVLPVAEEYEPVTQPRLMRELSVLVEPEEWPALEVRGEGDVSLMTTYGLPLKMTLYRCQGRWSAVVHL